jgi:hypothetical protein
VDAEMATAMIAPAQDSLFDFYEVSAAVNRVANDEPGLIEPITPGAEQSPALSAPAKPKRPKDARQGSLFEDSGQGSLF